jgi:single-strand DNA-binding protein
MLKALLIGNIGKEPEMRYNANGDPFLRFTVASNGRRRVKDEWQDETTWVRVTVMGKRAESLANLLTKGTRVYVDGRLTAQPWTTQDGTIMAGLEMVASDVEFASSRQDGEGGQATRPAPQQAAPVQRQAPAREELSELELPF